MKMMLLCAVLIGPAVPAYGQDQIALRVVLSARRCTFARLLAEARRHPGDDIEPPERFAQLLADTDARLTSSGLKKMSCRDGRVRIAEMCLVSVHGEANVPMGCFSPGTRQRDVTLLDGSMPLPGAS